MRPAQLTQQLMSCLTDTSSKGTRHRITRIIPTPRRHFDTASILLVQVLHRQVSSIKTFRVRKSNVPRDWFSPACFSRTEAAEVEGCQGPNGKIGRFENCLHDFLLAGCQSSRFQTIRVIRGRSCQPRRCDTIQAHAALSNYLYSTVSQMFFQRFITRRNQVLVRAQLLVDRSQAK